MFTGVQRSKNILAKVRAYLGQLDDTDGVNDLIFALATAKMIDIAETYCCVEATGTLAVVANTADYDLTSFDSGTTQSGFFRKKLLSPPMSSRATIQEQDVNEWDFQKRYGRVTTGLPLFYIKIFKNILTFNPTPTATESWTLYYYKSPTTTISKSVAPETPSSFDSAIACDVAAHLWAQKGNEKASLMYATKAANEEARGVESWRARKTEAIQITYEDV